MKIQLLFDGPDGQNQWRSYELSGEISLELLKGRKVTVTFCHPKFGEVMIAKAKGGALSNEDDIIAHKISGE